jgi:anti-sigma B factor antagonist
MKETEFEVVSDEAAPGVVVLTPAEELDLASVPRLDAAVSEALRPGTGHLVLDLGRLTFVDSSGLRMFLALCQRAKAENWQLTLTRPSAPVRALFEITGAGPSLPLVDDWESP